ncbi:MAG: 50S ribosomal protein L29 [Candidatus Omnitrophota bacterium]
MKFKDISGLGQQELIEKEKALKEELYKLNYQRYSGRVEKPHNFSLIKKDIARIKTAIRQIRKS